MARVQNRCLKALTLPTKTQTAKPQDNCPRSFTSKAFLLLRFLITVYLYAFVFKKDTACLNTPTIPWKKKIKWGNQNEDTIRVKKSRRRLGGLIHWVEPLGVTNSELKILEWKKKYDQLHDAQDSQKFKAICCTGKEQPFPVKTRENLFPASSHKGNSVWYSHQQPQKHL